MRVDEAFDKIGFGRFQLSIGVAFCAFGVYLPMHLYSYVFMTYEPDHTCMFPDPGNETSMRLHIPIIRDEYGHEQFASCHKYNESNPKQIISCDGKFYYKDFGNTSSVITEWNLSCEKEMSVTIVTQEGLASIAGALVFSPLADKFGRKPLLLLCWFQMSLMYQGLYLIGDMSSFLVLRFLARMHTEGAEMAMFLLTCEFVPIRKRPAAAFSIFILYAIGQLLLAMQAYLFMDWRRLQMALSIATLVLLSTCRRIPESPFWLASEGKTDEAEKIFRRAAKKNKVELPPCFRIDSASDEHEDQPADDPSFSVATAGEFHQHHVHAHVGHVDQLIEVLKNGTLRKHFFVTSFMWAVSSYIYTALTVTPVHLNVPKSLFLGFALCALVSIPAFCSILIMRKFGRKKPVITFFILGGSFLILYSRVPSYVGIHNNMDLRYLLLFFKLVSKLGSTAAMVTVRLIVIELFPTSIRSTCCGMAAFIGLLGSMAGMYYPICSEKFRYTGTVVGGFAVIASVLGLMIPDTANRPLPENVRDLSSNLKSLFDVFASAGDLNKDIELNERNNNINQQDTNNSNNMRNTSIINNLL